MATLTIYLDDETLDSVTAAAKRENKSVSGWAREHLKEAAKPSKGWPEGYFEKIKSWGESDLEAPEEIPIPLDDIHFDEPEPAQDA